MSGRILVGADQAKFVNAVWISALAVTANILLGSYVGARVYIFSFLASN